AVCDAVDDELLAGVRVNGAALAAGLAKLPSVVETRGRGLLLAAELDGPAGAVVDACRERGLLVGTAGERVLRLTPPLVVSAGEIELALATLREVLQ
ncbi:MAG: aminotransferase class III-fold pyridoxal phosphate-dependent enzyme, partial [Gaiellaceae bacterium]